MMERYRIPRLLGITIIYVAIVGIITLIVNLLIPIIGSQIESFIKNTPNYLHKITRSLDKLNNNTILSVIWTSERMVRICSEKIPSMVSDYSDGFGSKLATFAEAVANIGIVIGTTPFVLFFMLKDGHKFKEVFMILGSYIHLLCHVLLLLFIGYSIIGLKYALVLASIAAVTSVVPYLGPTIAISPAIVIAITSPLMLLKLAVVWTLVQFFEGHCYG